MGASRVLNRLEPSGAGALMNVSVALLRKILSTESALEWFDLLVDQKVVFKAALTRKLFPAVLKLA